MSKVYQSLGELEAAHPEAFRNPVVSDAEFDRQMERNRLRAAAEDAAAELQAAADRKDRPCLRSARTGGYAEGKRYADSVSLHRQLA